MYSAQCTEYSVCKTKCLGVCLYCRNEVKEEKESGLVRSYECCLFGAIVSL